MQKTGAELEGPMFSDLRHFLFDPFPSSRDLPL